MNHEEYSDKTTVTLDLKLFLALKSSSPLDLSMFPKLASDRWPWMIANWESALKPLLKGVAGGDSYLEDGIEQIENHITGWRSGSSINPYNSTEFFSNTSELLEYIPLDSLGLTVSEQEFVNTEAKRISEFNSSTFQAMLRFLRTQRDLAFDFIGLGDVTYNSYKKRTSGVKQRDFFISDLEQIDQAVELEHFILGIILDFKNLREVEPNLLRFANRNLTSDSGAFIEEDIYKSYTIVPFEQTLEQMAQDYLGTKTRWFELVTVNNLKPPFVDLAGTKIVLTENASTNSLRVPILNQDRFRIGANIKIGSRVVPDEIRRIEQFTDNQDSTVSLYLSGAQDLSKLKLNHAAFIKVYKPETIQDFSYVKIPVALDSPYARLAPPTRSDLKALDKALYAFGVDVAVDTTSAGDLVLSPTGDLKLSFGLDNVRQAINSVIATSKGELPLHADYGIPNMIGNALGGDVASQIAVAVQQAISRDPRYTLVRVAGITISPEGKISMTVEVKIAGSDQLIPLAYVV